MDFCFQSTHRLLCCQNLINIFIFYSRICDLHIKADVFTREGEQLRFCQRCGYAHPLAEFDGLKHSCRAQLQKHNERRRKKKAGGASSKEQEPKPCCGSKKETSSSSGAARPSTQSHVQLVSGSGSGSPTANAQPPFGINPAGPFAAVSGATEDDKADPPPLPVLDFDVPDDLLHPGQVSGAPVWFHHIPSRTAFK